MLTLALGIGANTAIFSLIHSALLRPLPYAEESRLVFVWSLRPAGTREPLTPGRLVDFREQLTTVTGVAGISQISFNLAGDGPPERLPGSSVSSNFFDVVAVPPLLGDTFHAGRAELDAVVLSHGLWMRRFGGDRSIVGRPLVINGTARRVVAVMPESFRWPAITSEPNNSGGPELWVPGDLRDIPRTPSERLDQEVPANRGPAYLRGVARLKAGVTLDEAARDADLAAARMAREHPRTDGTRGAALVPLRTQFFGHVTRPLLILLGGVAVVLAMACANVASLLLGRASQRRTEIAVRLAIGASRARIVRQLLTESVVLALAGGLCGVLLASWMQSSIASLGVAQALRADDARLDPAVLAFTCVLAVVTGVLFGVAPAWQAVRGSMRADLSDGSTRASSGRRAARTRELLVMSQIAVSLVLLIGAALLLRSFSELSRVDTGIDTRHLLTFSMSLNGPRGETPARQAAFYDEALAGIRALPGIEAAAAAVTLPIGGDTFSTSVTFDDRPVPEPGQEAGAGWQVTTPGYFAAMGIPILSGRDFDDRDLRAAAAATIVNRTFADRHWPGRDPVGRRIRLGRTGEDWMTVVGIVEDIRHGGPGQPARPEVYQPHRQQSFSFMAFVVRTAGDPAAMVPSLRAAIARLDPTQPISDVATMEEHIATALARPRLLSTLVGSFGGLALVLALVGIYGVMSYSVAERTREIGIRMALGAGRAQVFGMVLWKAAALASIGVAAGLVVSRALTGVLTGLLFGVTATDGTTFALAAAALLAFALLAAALPAVRATRVSGASILRP